MTELGYLLIDARRVDSRSCLYPSFNGGASRLGPTHRVDRKAKDIGSVGLKALQLGTSAGVPKLDHAKRVAGHECTVPEVFI